MVCSMTMGACASKASAKTDLSFGLGCFRLGPKLLQQHLSRIFNNISRGCCTATGHIEKEPSKKRSDRPDSVSIGLIRSPAKLRPSGRRTPLRCVETLYRPSICKLQTALDCEETALKSMMDALYLATLGSKPLICHFSKNAMLQCHPQSLATIEMSTPLRNQDRGVEECSLSDDPSAHIPSAATLET